MNSTRIRRAALWVGLLAIFGMGSVTVACSSNPEKPTESSVPSSPSTAPSSTEKGMRTNVTRAPISAVPPGGGAVGGNAAVPCGFGPSGGGPCSANN